MGGGGGERGGTYCAKRNQINGLVSEYINSRHQTLGDSYHDGAHRKETGGRRKGRRMTRKHGVRAFVEE
jgi:hypothetical protein